MWVLKSKKKKTRKWSGRGTCGDLMKRGLGVAEPVNIRLKALYNNPRSVHAGCGGGGAYLRAHNIEKFKSAVGDIL